MNKFILMALLLLAGCGFQQKMEGVDNKCNKEAAPLGEIARSNCFTEGERPLIAQFYPDALSTYDELASKRIALARKEDAGEITPDEFKWGVEPFQQRFIYVIRNYEPLRAEAAKINYCTSIGAPPTSPNYYNCRRSLDEQIAALQVQQQAASLQYLGALQQSNAINNGANNIAGAINRPRTTNCMANGPFLNCNSF